MVNDFKIIRVEKVNLRPIPMPTFQTIGISFVLLIIFVISGDLFKEMLET